MWIATAERSRELDRLACERFGIPSRVLMERAGLAVFEAVRELLPEGGRITVLAGKGNNGGDGFVVARLAVEHGFDVDCLVAAREGDLSPDARDQCIVSRAQGVTPLFCDDARYARKLADLRSRDLIVDGLLGTGARGNVEGPIAEALEAIQQSGVPVVAIDIPSGIDCDTGEEMGISVWALRTVTFGLPKPYLFQGLGIEHAGYWTVADIGLPMSLLQEPTEARLIGREWVANLLPERMRGSHKGENGHVVVIGGSREMPGAVILAARSALRSGAGLVTVASTAEVCRAVAASVPEAVLFPLPDRGGALAPEAADQLRHLPRRADALLFGPGLTHQPLVREFLERAWTGLDTPCVIDADALNAVAHGVELPPGDCVLTPHPGELSRLMQSSIAEIQADRFRSARSACERFGKTVLLKGPYSIIAHPETASLVNTTGNSGMAAGGMGDVLSGVIATLLAQDLPSLHAAACGAYWHGAAGDMCAEEIGTVGFLASELAERLPPSRVEICQIPGCGGVGRRDRDEAMRGFGAP